ncbi:response regulator [Microvirga ossetica]|uniref:response regulator n=1 Tax=Microvirga ossetica TaxID=1882682 RepID=UPI001F224181|nr:response regulator transcription factor [Microvirga ossetica]
MAADGKRAVELAGETQPDVVILDHRLPLMNGIDATREIRAFHPQTEVLIFTMHQGEPLLRELLEAGARGYVLKSDARRVLIAAVDALARHQPFFTGQVSETLLSSYLAFGSPPGDVLTPRELGVVQLIAEGRTNKEAAQLLGINLKTAKTYCSTAMRKLKAHTSADLVRYAVRNKLAEPQLNSSGAYSRARSSGRDAGHPWVPFPSNESSRTASERVSTWWAHKVRYLRERQPRGGSGQELGHHHEGR